MKKKNSIGINIIIIAVYVLGVGILLYPVISNVINSRNQTVVVSDYKSKVSQYKKSNQKELEKIRQQAIAYNKELVNCGWTLYKDKGDFDHYNQQLLLPGTDVMAYITIPSINVQLPIYHGTDSSVLQKGVGHIEGTSLPIGGINTHSVLSGHRGLPSGGVLFSHLNLMEIGDIFSISVLGKRNFYQVYDIKTVLPNKINSLGIQRGKDLVTLVTCTPYSINTHRLLVHAKRVFLNLNIISNCRHIPFLRAAVGLWLVIVVMELVLYGIGRKIYLWIKKSDGKIK